MGSEASENVAEAWTSCAEKERSVELALVPGLVSENSPVPDETFSAAAFWVV